MDPRATGGTHDPRRERWIDEAAGPLVRPYAMTRGRTVPTGEPLDIVAIVVATGRAPADLARLSREQRRLLSVCRRPHTIADLASEVNLPLGVVRVLAGDLLEQGLLRVQQWTPPTAQVDQNLLRRVLDELRAL
jgi:Protein of unknown function (DUF742)